MSYSGEVTRRAQQRLSHMKADHESQYNQRLFEAYGRVPRLKEIDLLLRKSMALAAQTVFTKGTDAVAAMEQVKQANLSLQEERRALLAQHFPQNYLDESPLCPHCGGSGYVGAVMCDCLRELCRQEQQEELRQLTCGDETFDRFRLDYYPEQIDPNYGASPRKIMERNLQICRRYAEEFEKGSGNLLFVGGTGLGKTFLSACIANEAARRGASIAYESAPQLFAKLSKNQFDADDQSRQDCARLTDCDLLIIDDLGTELTTSVVIAALYSLLNERLLAGKSMIVSTNLNIDEIARRYSPQIASRLEGSFRGLTFVGKDIRVMKNRGL